MLKFTLAFIILLISETRYIQAQDLLSEKNNFTKQDTLRGSITPERSWWNLTYYHLDIVVKPDSKFISGSNTIEYKVIAEQKDLQIDLQPPLKITKVIQDGEELNVTHEGKAHFIKLNSVQNIGTVKSLQVFYEGQPKEAIRAPWDGGFSWSKDSHGNDFVATSCQGLGASVWWPCKDHMYDEVDSMLISVNVPKNLMDVSNGRLRSIKHYGDTKTYHWVVKNPINNYGVNVNIGDYAHFSEVYDGISGNLTMDYYVLKDNLEKAKEHFKDATKMMEAFEHWFGPYPFYKDGFKLVEVPYLGMEHQSSVTYGNQYKKGYLGNDLSGTGWGLKFDFIIIHESGHEWFANNITYKDIADMWIHEGFTAYSENLFLDYYYGKQASADYVIGTRQNIQNDKPIIGQYNVNQEGSGDMYYKGSNMLHTLRQLIEDDEKWRQILRGLNLTFYHQTVTTKQIENYISTESGIDLTAFFNQYLRTTAIPNLEYNIENKELKYRWTHIVDNFDMPVQITINDKEQWLFPSSEWKTMPLKSNKTVLKVDRDFYVNVTKL
ncbi:MAG: M1 family metallopeptidase [Flavobacteriales bacterium]|nr:M1 family metallopeptidase [Flavobacteriia bacterium]NCP05310.1 M1 family metallopeptidase [Flavobacteriales bacterium]PIV93065.1 MAG: peptidase M1 [Flavobacteriaceae bacterium CG17_big_fil_post_rev_8_21_14_2_50_33_15]PIY11869.1 MAG: peptidase M1 [Flavobacteriaceae bacterium CG_4_10_14_3_um_filter_33_47]PJB18287.1 MAG: peptidase M1 [Flavobacteriaceae bacterium CG_4_9_14_3_um_filter_33_16]